MKRPRKGRARPKLPPPTPGRRIVTDTILAGSLQGVPCVLSWTEEGDLVGRIVVLTAREESGGTGANPPLFEAQRYEGPRPATAFILGGWCQGQGFVPGPIVSRIVDAERFFTEERNKHGYP